MLPSSLVHSQGLSVCSAHLYTLMLGLSPMACQPSTSTPAKTSCRPVQLQICCARASSWTEMRSLSLKACSQGCVKGCLSKALYP